MYRFVMTSLALTGALTGIVHAQNAQIDATREYKLLSGTGTTENDGTFNYQGYLQVDGEPANGMYSFRFEAFEEPTGPSILSELFFISQVIPVVDGLFNLDVQMGGDAVGGRRFWSEVGDKEIYLEIGVGLIEGGPYETLGTRSKVGWSARAQYSGISEALKFPYVDAYENENGDPATMISLTSVFGGTLIDLKAESTENEPLLRVQGATTSGIEFGFQNGAIHVDAVDRAVGLISMGSQFSIVGILPENATAPNVAILGQVNTGASGATAIRALNTNGGTGAQLGTDTHGGVFFGDVLVEGDVQRTYNGTAASAAPIAYGYINASGTIASGTENFTCVWDAVSDRYLISIDNESYFFNLYTTNVTSGTGSTPRISGTSSIGGQLVVYILDPVNSYSRVQSSFQFAVYKTDPNITVINRNTTTMDDSDFYELHGLTPEVIRIGSPARPNLEGAGITSD